MYSGNDGESTPIVGYILENKLADLRECAMNEPDSFLAKGQDGRTPLAWAFSKGTLECCSFVLKVAKSLKGFDINDADNAGWTLLHIASSLDVERVKLLLPLKPNVNKTTNSGTTAIQLAVSKQKPEIVALLIESGANLAMKDKNGGTCLQRAAAIGSVPLTQLLIQNNAPLNASDNNGWTALHHAYAEGNPDVSVALLIAGIDPTRQNKDQQTAEQVALDHKVVQHVRAIMSNRVN